MAHPTLIFGTGYLGLSFPTPLEINNLLSFLSSHSLLHLDTARRYPALHPGLCEKLLGDAKAAEKGFVIDTKINPLPSGATGVGGSLQRGKIRKSVRESFEALGVERVRVLYVHMRDEETGLEESAGTFEEGWKKGEFEQLGLCNDNVATVEEWQQIAAEKGWVRPSVYQGQYNLLCRRAEGDLMPTLRRYGMVFNAYSPLAGGFLTGKATSGNAAGTRFEAGNKMGSAYNNWYDKPVMHEAVTKLQEAAHPLGLTLPEVAMRWLMYHSALGKGDGIIIGGSRLEQIEGSLRDVDKGALPESILKVVDEVWEMVKDDAP